MISRALQARWGPLMRSRGDHLHNELLRAILLRRASAQRRVAVCALEQRPRELHPDYGLPPGVYPAVIRSVPCIL